MRTLGALLLGLALLAAPAAAGEQTLRESVLEALRRGDRRGALAAVEAFASPAGQPDRGRSLEAAMVAMNLIEGPDGNLHAARILVDALGRDRSDHQGVYGQAMKLRKRVFDESDTPAALELFQGLVRIYPELVEFRFDFASALRDAGRAEDARAQYRQIKENAPSDTRSRFELAELEANRGAVEEAVALYDEILRLRPAELRAHLLKVQVLWRVRYDFDAARTQAALDAGLAAARTAEPSGQREDYLARLVAEEREFEAELRRRQALVRIRARLHRTLLGVAAAWALLLGGGVLLLRRARWI